MKSILKYLILSLLTLCLPGISVAKPIEVRSENFVFYGDVSEKRAVELIEGLENYRSILFTVYDVEALPEYIPVRIVGFKKQKELEKASGRSFGGIYGTTIEGPVFILSTEDGLKQGKQGWNIAFHEYTHHMLASFTTQNYPRWYNEGLAEYLSTFKIKKDGEFEIGLPSQGRAWALANYDWMPMDVLINSVHRYPFNVSSGKTSARAMDLFYAQSWLAVHFLQSNSDYNAKFKNYLSALNSGQTSDNLFETTTGISFAQFETLLRNYNKANKYSYLRAQLRDGLTTPSVSVRRISDEEIMYQQADILRLMSYRDEDFAAAKAYLNTVKNDLGDTTDMLLLQAAFALQDGQYVDAKTFAKQAVDREPNNPKANHLYAKTLISAHETLGASYGSIDDAKTYLKTAMRLNPDDAPSHYLYAKTYDMTYTEPSAQAVASAEIALDYYRSEVFIEQNIDMAAILARAGQKEDAARIYQRIMIWGTSPSLRRFAANEMARLGFRSEAQP